MKTKICIILIALIFMFPETISVGASVQKQLFHVQNAVHVSPANNHQTNKPVDITLNWSYNDDVHHSHNSDDDNKTNHFHYNRFSRHRNKILYSILFKILLAITHISSLLFATMHLMH